LSSYAILPIILTKKQQNYFYKQFVRQNTAQNVICDVTNDINVLLVLDFNKMCVKIVKSTDVISLCVLLTGNLQKIVLCISGFVISTQVSRIL